MRISPPKIVVYGRDLSDAYDLICDRLLGNCEPCAVPWLGIVIADPKDLTVFALRFAQDVEFEGHLAVVTPGLIPEVENFLLQMSMGDRVQRHDLAAVQFWDTDDEAAFARAWG